MKTRLSTASVRACLPHKPFSLQGQAKKQQFSNKIDFGFDSSTVFHTCTQFMIVIASVCVFVWVCVCVVFFYVCVCAYMGGGCAQVVHFWSNESDLIIVHACCPGVIPIGIPRDGN